MFFGGVSKQEKYKRCGLIGEVNVPEDIRGSFNVDFNITSDSIDFIEGAQKGIFFCATRFGLACQAQLDIFLADGVIFAEVTVGKVFLEDDKGIYCLNSATSKKEYKADPFIVDWFTFEDMRERLTVITKYQPWSTDLSPTLLEACVHNMAFTIHMGYYEDTKKGGYYLKTKIMAFHPDLGVNTLTSTPILPVHDGD